MSHHQGFRAIVRRLRRGFRRRLSLWLASRRGTPEPIRAPLPQPRRILVCRLNARLGNILFLTPLLRSLADAYPHAEIDVLLRSPAHAELLAGMPGVCRVHALPKSLPRIVRLARTLRGLRYDLAIDPSTQSSGDRFALLLSGARNRLGFAGHDQWLSLTHAAPRPASEPHQARKALYLLTDAIEGLRPRLLQEDLAVYPGTEARREGQRLLREALGSAGRNQAWPVVGFFTEATGPKRLSDQWWRAWHAALTDKGTPVTLVQILRPGEDKPLAPGIPALRSDDLSVLAAVLGRMDLFVAADSGPMHLAAAAGVPVIGLFTATEPAHYAPLGRDCLSLTGPLDPAMVADRTRRHLDRAGSTDQAAYA